MTASRSHLINVVATPLWGVMHRSEPRISERRTAPWLQRVRIYEMASKRRGLWLVAIFLLASLLAVSTTRAHDARPAYLEIKETSPHQFSVLWRTPVLAGTRLPVVLTMPGDVKDLKEPVQQELADSLLERRWIDAGANGLAGKRIEFRGLQVTITDVLVRVEMLDGRAWTMIAHPSQPWFELAGAPSKLHVAGAYLRLGIEHIWSGVDHLLFILALMILVKGTRRLIATVTAFTVAHSITLGGRDARFRACATTTGRGLYRFEHRFCRQRDCSCAPGSTGLDRALAMGDRLHLWPAAWIRFRWRVKRGRSASDGNSSGLVVFQCWRGDWATSLHRERS